MKTIGSTPNGGYIVEMTQAEHRALEKLVRCAGDGSKVSLMYDSYMPENDIENWINTVFAFAASRELLEMLQSMVGSALERLEP